MLRALVTLVVLTPLAVAAPPPKAADEKAGLYYPTTVGTKWVLETKAGDATTESTVTVTGVVEKDGVFRVTTETVRATAAAAGPRATAVTHEVSAAGLATVARAGAELKIPQPLLKLPAKKGDTWGVGNGPAAGGMTYTVGEPVEVEVPAGKFKAIPVERTESGAAGGTPFTSTLWYAPGVGLVKSVVKLRDQERTTVLKSFTLGTDQKQDEPK
ncbi:hypothetical protein [Limnoglobus roseus]|uniref:Uncharacterized protein n=1 Tax=Limnoglobus roseus TaxID=2598579 RepID=A0A5C1AH68_9BACT|nr:hypothetical protein [Limnoglobus roseus]QEL17593.1 hypothetical protein PX52LOC_04589 [Limnoglobus roseus]